MFKKILTAIIAVLAVGACYADDIVSVSGEGVYVGSDEDSKAHCKRMALECAKANALAKKFGTIISQDTYSKEQLTSSGESSYFDLLTTTEVKGEWIADEGEPEYIQSTDSEGNIVMTCRVKGKAKPLSNKAPDFEALVMRNGTDRKFAQTDFKEGDDLYVLFRAPVDGYVAIYMTDDANTASALLPYRDSDGKAMKVARGKEYVFFHRDKSGCPASLVDEMTMEVSSPVADVERDHIYVIFSPNPFVKANDKNVGGKAPNSLPTADFNKWLLKSRRNDGEMGVKRIGIVITR